MKRLIPFLLMTLLFALPAHAQEDCDLSALSQSYSEQIASAESWEDWQAITTAMQTESRRCTTPTDETIGMSRSAPVPLGEGFSFADGTLTVNLTELLDESPGHLLPEPEEGMVLVRAELSLLCAKEDEDETCMGRDIAAGSALVTEAGEVINTLLGGEDSVYLWEAYPGVTLTGSLYFLMPEEATLGQLRLRPAALELTPVFFALD
jgi:hypothetical protein